MLLINPNIDFIINKLRILNQFNRQRTPLITILITIINLKRTFTLFISLLKLNTRAEYNIIKERLKAYNDSYNAKTRLSKEYL